MVKSNGHFYTLSDLESKNIQPRNFLSWHGLIDAIPVNWKKELKSKAIPHTPPFDPQDYNLVLNSVKVSLSEMDTKTFYEAHMSDLHQINIMFGLFDVDNHFTLLNHMLTAKQTIFLCRQKSITPSFIIFLAHLKKNFRIEEYLAKEKKKLNLHLIKWEKLLQSLS
ncbi:hypothetical protein pdam_00020492 [Pocillopora damicornis]|uniref:Uncharacterized protein n=1 Tax=Pocillopora damicornis TaxID=46731 RepID=A0A3M6UFA3_POCDA|nr:hypothetical protein pdam_00020492 [Pocillopora damicornis]